MQTRLFGIFYDFVDAEGPAVPVHFHATIVWEGNTFKGEMKDEDGRMSRIEGKFCPTQRRLIFEKRYLVSRVELPLIETSIQYQFEPTGENPSKSTLPAAWEGQYAFPEWDSETEKNDWPKAGGAWISFYDLATSKL